MNRSRCAITESAKVRKAIEINGGRPRRSEKGTKEFNATNRKYKSKLYSNIVEASLN